ncbi:Integrase core domain [Popillia japonica]|uniref:Integrase core domain n=1 Tax=Popillia japonica TaxID=7064 RepID=A0AAW1L809_POPJA
MADTNLLGNLQTFDHKNSDFTVFNERLNQFFVANSITEETKRKAILLNSLSEECYILVRNLCVPDLPENKTFSALVKILKEHFCPVKSYFAERLAFFSARRKSNEAVCDWAARLKSLASTCDFKTELNIVLRDIFVIGMNDNWTFSTNNTEIARFDQGSSGDARNVATDGIIGCKYTCNKCGIKGHLAQMCKRKNVINFMVQDNFDSIFHLKDYELDNKGNVNPTFVELLVEGISIKFEADSGFAHSAISDKLYFQHFKNIELCENDLSLRDYVGVSFDPMGYVNLNITFENKDYKMKTYVIKNGGPPLIGRNSLFMLNLGNLGQGFISITSTLPPKSNLITWSWPTEPWTRLHIDFFGPCLNKNFIVIEDATSKWIECFEVSSVSSEAAIKVLRELFARFGLPNEICSDNAKAFTSHEFQKFLNNSGIKHLTGAPYHAATNGLAESGVKIMKNAILKGRKELNRSSLSCCH